MRLVIATAGATLLAACGPQEQPAAPPEPVVESYPTDVIVDEQANGREITLERGRDLVVLINACGSCGYRWALTALPANLSLLSIREVRPGGPQPVGDGFVLRYRFKAEQGGTGLVEFKNRPSSGNLGNAFRITVTTAS